MMKINDPNGCHDMVGALTWSWNRKAPSSDDDVRISPCRPGHELLRTSTRQRLAEVPGLGIDSAQQVIAEVGATAATFPSSKHLASWMGACPGSEESAGTNYSHRCPKGNRQMRRVLNQAANAAVKAEGTIFAIVYRRLVPPLGHANNGQRRANVVRKCCPSDALTLPSVMSAH